MSINMPPNDLWKQVSDKYNNEDVSYTDLQVWLEQQFSVYTSKATIKKQVEKIGEKTK